MKNQATVPNPNDSPELSNAERARVKYDASGHGLVTELESVEPVATEQSDAPVDKAPSTTH
jgi:hypothetical protein